MAFGLRRLVLLVPALALALLPSCGDDDAEDEARASEASSELETTTTTTSAAPTTVADADAEEPPGPSGGADDGRDEPPVWVADLTGDTEVPGPGHPSAVGRTEIETGGEGELCIDMAADGLGSEVTDAHIHEGTAGTSGPPVIPIGRPTSSAGDTDTWTDVCVEVDGALLDRLIAEPEAFYANVHTAELPKGAVRGQLTAASIFDLTLS